MYKTDLLQACQINENPNMIILRKNNIAWVWFEFSEKVMGYNGHFISLFAVFL